VSAAILKESLTLNVKDNGPGFSEDDKYCFISVLKTSADPRWESNNLSSSENPGPLSFTLRVKDSFRIAALTWTVAPSCENLIAFETRLSIMRLK